MAKRTSAKEASPSQLIDAKIENREPEAIEEPQLGAKVIDLMEALKRSVGNKKGAPKIAAAKAEAPKRTGKAKAAKETKAPARRTRAA